MPVIAGDLNPVAVMLTKAATEIPDKFAGCPPVNPFSLLKTYSDTEGLAEDVQYYGGILRELVREKLQDLYPNEPEGTASAWIWARTVKCPNPACGCQMPMVTSFVLNSKPGQEAWIEPSAVDGEIVYTVQHGSLASEQLFSEHLGSNVIIEPGFLGNRAVELNHSLVSAVLVRLVFPVPELLRIFHRDPPSFQYWGYMQKLPLSPKGAYCRLRDRGCRHPHRG